MLGSCLLWMGSYLPMSPLGSLKPTNLINTLTSIYVKYSLTNQPCLTVLQGQQRRAAIYQVFAGVFSAWLEHITHTHGCWALCPTQSTSDWYKLFRKICSPMLSRSDLPSPHLVYLPGAHVKCKGNHPTPTQGQEGMTTPGAEQWRNRLVNSGLPSLGQWLLIQYQELHWAPWRAMSSVEKMSVSQLGSPSLETAFQNPILSPSVGLLLCKMRVIRVMYPLVWKLSIESDSIHLKIVFNCIHTL